MMSKKNDLTGEFILIFIVWLMSLSLILGQNDIMKKLPITTNCEMSGLGITKDTIIDRPKKMIIIKCAGGGK